MHKIQCRNMSWLGLISLMFLVMSVPAAAAQKTKTAEPAAKIDINHATEKQLEDLPGVGKATANKIIAGRPYASVDDLAKAGVSKSTIAKITPLVSVGAAPAVPAAKAAVPATTSPANNSPAASAASAAPPAAGMVWVNLNTKVYHNKATGGMGRPRMANI